MVVSMNKCEFLIVNRKSTCIYYENNEMIIRSNFSEFSLKVDEEMFEITKEVLLKSNKPIEYEILIKDLEVNYNPKKVKQIIKMLLQNKIIMTMLNEDKEYLSDELFNIFTQITPNPFECFSLFRKNTFEIFGKDSALIDALHYELKKYHLLIDCNSKNENNIAILIDEIPDDVDRYKNLYIILTEDRIGAVSICRYIKGNIEENKLLLNDLKRKKNTYNIKFNEIFLKIFALNALYYIINDQSNNKDNKIVKKLVVTINLEVYSQDLITGKPSDTIKVPVINENINENENVLKVNLLQELEIFINEYCTFIEGCSTESIGDIVQFPISAYSLKFKNDNKVYVNFSDEYINSGVGAIKYLLKEYLEKVDDKEGFWIIDFNQNIREQLMENLIEKHCNKFIFFKLENIDVPPKYRYLIDYLIQYNNINSIEVFVKKVKLFPIYQVMIKADEEIWSTSFNSNLEELMDIAVINLFGMKVNANFHKEIVTPLKHTKCVLEDSVESISWNDIYKFEKMNEETKIEMLKYVNELKLILVEEAWAYEPFLCKSGFAFRKFILNGVDK